MQQTIHQAPQDLDVLSTPPQYRVPQYLSRSVMSDSWHPVDCRVPGSSVLCCFLEFAQIQVH